MTLHGGENGILILLNQGAQSVSQSGTDTTVSKLLFGHRRESGSDFYSTSHPLDFTTEATGDGADGQSLLVHQRADHPCFIQSGKRARR